MNIDKLKNIVRSLSNFNTTYAPSISDAKDTRDDGRLLSHLEDNIDKIEKAFKIRPALGVFGQSQCGKSYLTSELIGGSNAQLFIEGVNSPNFQNYNQTNAQRECTALVTRFTDQSGEYNLQPQNVSVSFLSVAEIMWSFVYGYYYELQWTNGFELNENQINSFRNSISVADSSTRYIRNPIQCANEFSECLSWVRENFKEPELCAYALDYFQKNDNISIEKLSLLVSTFWNCDEHITKAFSARIETLFIIDFSENGSVPESLLERVLDASSMAELPLSVSPSNFFGSNNGQIFDSNNQGQDIEKITNLQCIIKEVVLQTEDNEDSLVKHMDILDFPGARGLGDVTGNPGSEFIRNAINNGKSKQLAAVYKRGKLLYLFDAYRKNFEITMLLFCSQAGNQEAPVLKEKLEEWVEMHNADGENADEPSLFVAFTKSDMLIKDSNDNVKDADNRITGRFIENFSDYYGSWCSDFMDTGQTFKNIYLVRNPQAVNECFDSVANREDWRPGFEKGSEIFQEAFMQNKSVDKFLGNRKNELFDNVFKPENDGIKNLAQNIINKFNASPNQKTDYLKYRLKDIESSLKFIFEKHYSGLNEDAAMERERTQARLLLKKIRQKKNGVSLILNKISSECPDPSYLRTLIMDATEPGVLGVNLKLNPLEESIPKFLRHWFKQAARSDEINSDLQIDRAELRKFFTNIGKYILQKDYISNMISNFDIFDVVQNPGDIKAVRNLSLIHI